MTDYRWIQITPTLWEFDCARHFSQLPLAPPAAIEFRRSGQGTPPAYWSVAQGDEAPDGCYPFGPYHSLEDAMRSVEGIAPV